MRHIVNFASVCTCVL